MTEQWIEIVGPDGSREHHLDEALTRIGGDGADIVLQGMGRGELHVWNEPPKAVWLGGAGGPTLHGTALDERVLVDGDCIQWASYRITFRDGAPEAQLEEVAAAPVEHRVPQAWLRVKAGILVEQGLADKKVAKRWSDAVLRGDFQADPCAREILSASTITDDDARLAERSSRLLRDFVMSPIHRGARGAGRKAKGAAKNFVAAGIAQFIIVGIILLMSFVMMVLARLKWGTSFDGWIDAVLG